MTIPTIPTIPTVPADLSQPLTPVLGGHNTVVLGGAGNVGEGIVRAHLAAGATVVVPSRKATRLEVVRRAMADGADRLIAIDGDTETFHGMQRIAEEAVERAGVPTHVVASIGGGYEGPPVWQTDERAFETYFVGSSRAHFAAARAFLPAMAPGGDYTMILGLSAYLALPGSSPINMHGGALRMLRQALVGRGRRSAADQQPRLRSTAQPRTSARRPQLAQLRQCRSRHPWPRHHLHRDRPGPPDSDPR